MNRFLLFFLIIAHLNSFAQHNHSHVDGLRKRVPQVPNYIFNQDSLQGFDEQSIVNEISREHFIGDDIKRVSYLLKRNYLDEKYSIGRYRVSKSLKKTGGTNPTTQSLDCATENFDFENGTGSGWNLSGTTQIVTSGTDPYGGFSWVYPGGTTSLRISSDEAASGDVGEATKTIAVPANGITLFTFHFAMAIFNFPHTSFDAARFKVDFFDSNNNPIPCPKFECYYSSDNGPVGVNTFTATSGPASSYNPNAVGDGPGTSGVTSSAWNDVTLDLTAYAGQTITAKFKIQWCLYGPDWAYALIDADCPINNFIPTPVCGGAGSNVCGPPNMLSYSWQTPTGGTATTDCITATTAGIYTLNVVPTNVQCSAAPTFTYMYDVKAAPLADFNFTYTPCQNSLSVPFADNSGLNGGTAITSYTWNWGDGTPNGLSANETHTFASEGIQTVTLSVTNGTCADEVVKTITITTKPTANFITTAVCEGLATDFTDISTTPISPITNWDWDFTNDNSIDANTQNPSTLFASSGTYTAELTVTSANGCSHSVTKPVEVYGHAIPNFTANSVCFGSSTNFTNTTDITSNPNTGSISTWSWNFDDSNTSNSQNPSNNYSTPSNNTTNTIYNVQLSVTTSNGCADDITKPVTVYSNPIASFIASEVCFNTATNFLSSSNGNGNPITSHAWDFTGDNLADITGPNMINYILPVSGNNTVSYTVTTTPVIGLTCKSSTTQVAITDPIPQASFTFTNNCINNQPNYFDGAGSTVSNGTITDYAWAFGDGQTENGTQSNTNHVYSLPILYSVTLTVTSDKGCVDSDTKQVEVYPIPLISVVSNQKVCLGGRHYFYCSNVA